MTLFEIMVAVLLLGMISVMIYSVLNVGIRFADKGEHKILAIAREQGFISVLHRQVNSAYFDSDKKDVIISADGDILRIVTRSPLLYRSAGLVLAIYRYSAMEQAVYYTEKRDYYNLDYDEEYVPDFEEMHIFLNSVSSLAMNYDTEEKALTVDYMDRQQVFTPRCAELEAGGKKL